MIKQMHGGITHASHSAVDAATGGLWRLSDLGLVVTAVILAALLIIQTVSNTAFAGVASSGIPPIVFEECSVAGPGGQISRRTDCATVDVPLRHGLLAPNSPALAEGERPMVSLFVVRLKARSSKAKLDPVLMIAGGPGESATKSFLFADKRQYKLSRDRDIYLIDQRGTGRSSPLVCEAYKDIDTEALNTLDMAQKLALQQHCLGQLAHDPAYFTTSVAVKDLEYVRQALAIAQWNIIGSSYGTRVAQHYLRRYPQAVRSVVLDGVVYPEHQLGSAFAQESQHALDAVYTRCEQDLACTKAFPELRAHVEKLIAALTLKAADINYESIQNGGIQASTFTLDQLRMVIRFSLYSDEAFSLLPVMLHAAYQNNNFAPLARSAEKFESMLGGAINMVMHNAVICSEDIAYSGADSAVAASASSAQASASKQSSYLGDDLMETMVAGCAQWPLGYVDSDLKLPLHADTPVLLLSGAADPITPPAYAERAIATLTNAKHIVFPGQGHGVTQLGCAPTLIAKFIDEASVSNIYESCVENLQAAPFFLDFNGPAP